MAFLDELLSDISENPNIEYKYTVNGSKSCCFQCINEILTFSVEKIIVRSKKNIFEISGKNFVIKKYCKGDLLFLGNVDKVVKINGDN